MKHSTTSAKAARRSRSDNEGASGEADLPMRCKYNTMEAKAAASSFEVNKPATTAAAASAEGGVIEREKDAADVTLAAAAEADTPSEGGGLRLSQAYVDFVLSWKTEVHEDPDELYTRLINNPDCFSRDDVERSTKLQRELVKQSKHCAASVERFHAWVCAEYEAKGYVEVDDDYIAQGVLLRQSLEEDELFALAFGPMEGVVAEDEGVAPSA